MGLHQAADEFQEAAWVVDRIAALPARGSVAVLYRMNAQSRLFEESLLRHRIPYAVVGGVGFYERREVKDLLAYLRIVVNSEDPVPLRRVVNVPPRGIGAKTVEELDRHRGRTRPLPLGRPGRRGRRGSPAGTGHPAAVPLPGHRPSRYGRTPSVSA